MKIILICFLFSINVLGQTQMEQPQVLVPQKIDAKEVSIEKNEPVQELVQKEEGSTSEQNRDKTHHTIALGYQPLSTWLPFKKAISYAYIFNRAWSIEGEYAWSSVDIPIEDVDIGEVSEKRFDIHARYYTSNSFNFLLGFFKNDLKAEVGSDILKNMSSTENELFRVQTSGIMLGMGNRWQFDNGIIFGVDWIKMFVPVFEKKVDDSILDSVTNATDRNDLKNTFDKLANIPTLVLLGLSLGYSF